MLHVTKSAYYDWRQRGYPVISVEAFALCARMKALFTQSRESLGSRGWSSNCARKGSALAGTECAA